MNTKSTFFCIATAAVFLNASYAQDYDKTIDGSAGPVDAHSAADLTGPSGLLSKLDLGSTDAANPAIINILDNITFAATEGTADQRLANNWYYSRHAEIRVADGKTLTFTANSLLHPDPDHGSWISGSALSWCGDLTLSMNTTLYIGAMSGGENSGRIVFSNNINSASNGGAICGRNSSLVISNADFISNSCTREDAYGVGGAIFSDSKLEIRNSSFENNTSAFREGGAIFANRSTVIKDSQFKNNNANMGGGAISSNYGLFIENSNFYGNSGSISGGAIINISGMKVVGSSFENNTGVQGGAILFLGASSNYAEATRQLEINESSFRNNAGNLGGAIFSQGTTIIENSTFENNSTVIKNEGVRGEVFGGGAICLGPQVSSGIDTARTIHIENSIFTGNTAIILDNSDNTATNCYGYGGAIYAAGYSSVISIKNSIFENNKSSGHGGAIFTEGQLFLENTDFIGNKDLSTTSAYGDSSAICAYGGIKISGGKFENNGGSEAGGAIKWLDYSLGGDSTRLLDINGTKFINNRSGTIASAGAITSNGNVKIVNAEFVGNETNGAGGAIDSNASIVTKNDPEDYSHFFYIENSVFRENKTVKGEFPGYQGGAISYQSSYKTQLNGIIKDTVFLDNSTVSVGGAVYVHGIGTLNFEVSSGKNIVSKGNTAISGGFLHMGIPQSKRPEDWENNRTESPEVIFEIGSNATYTIGSATDRGKDDIAGTGILRKTGKGVLILNANNEKLYTQTIVDEGRLVIDGILGAKGTRTDGDIVSKHSLTVNDGGVLGGSGKISGETTVNAGGVIAPGNSPGTITFDKLILNDGAILDIEKGDLIVADELDLSNIVNGVELNFTGFSQGDTVRFLEIRDIIGIDLETENLNDYFIANGFDFYFDADTNSIIANYVVPEPATAAAILGVFALAFAAYKRRK